MTVPVVDHGAEPNRTGGPIMLMQALGQSQLADMTRRGQTRSYEAGQTVYARGAPGGSLLIVQSGRAEVSITTPFGRKSIIGVAGPGAMIGEIACLDGGARSADVLALEPLEAVVVDRRAVLDILSRDPPSAIRVIEALCEKARNATDMVEILSIDSGRSRLAACLLRLLGEEGDEDGSDRIRVSQSWLASYVGLSRENVNRQLRAWVREDLISLEAGVLTVPDRQRLEDVAINDPGAGG
jgi:CRP-like cAMP-binding protein